MTPRCVRALVVCASVVAATAADPEPSPRRDSVVVTGTYEPIPLEEADRSVRSLDVEGLRLLSNSVADFLRLDPSLDLRQRAAGGVQADVSIRGSSFGQTLVLLDGIRMNDVQSGHHNLDLPAPIESVERIEVLKGSGSTLYGSDAVGGVVNLITRRPETSELRLRAAVGSHGTNQQRTTLAWMRGAFGQQLTFSRDFSSGFMANRDFRNLSVASKTFLESRLGSSEISLAHNDRPFGAEQFYGNYHSWERTRTWFGALRQQIGSRTQGSFAFRRHTDLFVLQRYNPQLFTNRHAVEGYQGSIRRREPLSANATFHYGGEAYQDSIVSNNLGRHDRARAAGYAALDLRALRRFSFNLGIRDEVHASANHEVSPSISGGVWLKGGAKLRAGVSRAFRLPTYTDLYYHDPRNLGSPSLRPESAWSYEAGLDWNPGGRWRAELTVFQRRERDGIDYVRRSPADIWRATNFQRLRFTGVEAGVGARAGNGHRVDLHYTGLRGVQDQLQGLESKYAFNYPVHSGLAGWQGTLPGGVLARVRMGALARLGREPYAVLDVYGARGAGRVRPFLQLTNLTDAYYQEIAGVDMPGRAIVGGIEIALFPSR